MPLRTRDARQLLSSVVVTNNGKNSKKWLKVQSVAGTLKRFTTATQTVTDSGESLDWMKNLRNKDNEMYIGKRGDWWFTGKSPTSETLKTLSTTSSHVSCIPQVTLKGVTETAMRNYFENSWLQTEILFASLQGEEAFYRPPYHHLRHPLIFYYGHPATFYTNKLRVAGLTKEGINAHYEELFEVGVDEMRWDDISTLSKAWPEIKDVHAYRQQTFKLVSDMISEQYSKQDTYDIDWYTPLWSIMMCVEHEKIHLETSSVLMRELPKHLLLKDDGFPTYHPSAKINSTLRPQVGNDFPKNEVVSIQPKRVTIGKSTPEDKLTYGWDNEFGERVVEVPAFQISKFKVSNGEYFDFVKSGGYREQKYWSLDGWGWRVFRNQKWPTFWVQRGPAGSHDYALRTIYDEIDMQWSWPVCVNYHEATAFCNWKAEQEGLKQSQIRLITEAEFHSLWDNEYELPIKNINNDVSVSKAGGSEYNNHLVFGSESAVNEGKANENGIYDLFGNVWEWSEDDFNSLPGSEVHPYYDDFSSPCYDGAHKMIFGGSFISSCDNGGNLYSRYHFRPHFHQHAGFRYVLPSVEERNIKGEGVATFLGSEKAHYSCEDVAGSVENKIEKETNTYETDVLLNQYVALHYGQSGDNVDQTVKRHFSRPDHALQFAQRSANLLSNIYRKHNVNLDTSKLRALDVGCAVGGASFELATSFGEVVGMDFSIAFVEKAKEIKNLSEDQSLSFKVPIQGKLTRSNVHATLPSKEVRNRTSFLTGDATKLKELNLGKFDAVLCANLICRLPTPTALFDDLKSSVNEGGIVLFLSPYSWLEEFTAEGNWLQQGSETSDVLLKAEMSKRGFTLVHEEDVPLLIREHERKYQYIVSHGLAFRKN